MDINLSYNYCKFSRCIKKFNFLPYLIIKAIKNFILENEESERNVDSRLYNAHTNTEKETNNETERGRMREYECYW
jgi:hypothetical protein